MTNERISEVEDVTGEERMTKSVD